MKKFDFTAIGRDIYPEEIIESHYFLIRQEISANRTRAQAYELMEATCLREKAQKESGFAVTSDYDLGLQEYLQIIGKNYNKHLLEEAIAFGYKPVGNEIKMIIEKQNTIKKRKI